jgi:hypothetical protein
MLEKIVPSGPDVIDRNSADDSCRAVQRFRGPLDETVDDQGEGFKDQSCGHEGKEGMRYRWGTMALVRRRRKIVERVKAMNSESTSPL